MSGFASLDRSGGFSDWRLLVLGSLPVIGMQYVAVLMQLADAAMVGRLGETALAALSGAGILLFILISFGQGCMMAVNAAVSAAYGSYKRQDCGSIAWAGIWSGLFLGVAALAFWPTAPVIFRIFSGLSEEAHRMQIRYFQVSLLALQPQFIAYAAGCYFIGIGRARYPLIAAVIALVVNICLNYGLIFGKFSLPQMGFIGSAWGTVYASYLYASLLLALVLFGRFRHRMLTYFRWPEWSSCKELLKQGVPIGVQLSIDAVAWGVVLVWLISFYGDVELAAATIVLRCGQVCFLPAEGVGYAITSLVARGSNGGKQPSAGIALRGAFCVVAVYMTMAAVLIVVFRHPIVRCFTSEGPVFEIASRVLVIAAVFQFFDAINIVYSNALRGVEDNVWPMLVNIALCLVVFLGLGLISVHFFRDAGSQVIWLIDGLYVVLQGLACWWRWKVRSKGNILN